MSKERLEEIKEKYNYERLGEFIDAKPISPYELKWLIKQAEKVEYWRKQHRKRANELEDAYFKIQLIENQLHQAQAKAERYKQALEEIARGRFSGASYKARQALEEKGFKNDKYIS